MALREILVKNRDSILPPYKDPKLDRQGCRKRGYVVAVFDSPHQWGNLECLPTFVVIKCDLLDTDLAAYEGFRKAWRDNFDYEITAQNPAQGRYSVRIWEVNKGASDQNAITGDKATKIQGYLTRWGCTSIVVGTNQLTFNIALWDACRSVEFWDVPAGQLAKISFVLDSYNSQTGVANITITHPVSWQKQSETKIKERNGIVLTSTSTSTTFTIERSQLFAAFKKDVKSKAEEPYMMQQYRINSTLMDQAVAAGGILEVTKAQLLAALRDMAAE